MRTLFYTGVKSVEHQLIMDCFVGIEKPVYLEVGVNYGGTFQKMLPKSFMAYGVDLFDMAYEEELNFKVGWPHRTQTHDIGGKFGLNTAIIDELTKALKKRGHDNFKLIKGYSHEQIPLIDDVFDVVFIDGNHTYNQTKFDFECCFKKSRIGTCFCFHNATEQEYRQFYKDGGPWKVCEELMDNKSLEYIGAQHTAKAFRRIK